MPKTLPNFMKRLWNFYPDFSKFKEANQTTMQTILKILILIKSSNVGKEQIKNQQIHFLLVE